MTILFNCQSIGKSFPPRILFQDLSLSVFEKERIGLIGPNGAGKSTLLKILAGMEKADGGTISFKRGLKVGYVPQSTDYPDLSPEEVLIGAITGEMPHYEKEWLADTWLTKMGFPSNGISASKLSGGWKKRLSLASALINDPELLLLDEPTNHLDLEGIVWLEKFLVKEAPSYMVVSHDRYFLQNVTSRIVEIDRVYPKGVFSVEGPYSFFLEKKGAFLEGQLEQERSLAGKLRKESDWLSRSPKARTTKSTARVDAAHEMMDQFAALKTRNTQKKAEISFAASERETRKLVVAHNISKEMGERTLFAGLDFVLSPGTRMGLMGPNGCGKTTLLRLISGELTPDAGTLKRADALKIVYFDQHKAQLPLNITLREALSPTGDHVTYNGRQIHVNGWCKRFLFSPDLLDMSVSKLSGGERARIAIAHLMLQPADILLLDEPTNDLDIATLETLEETLLDFPGAVVLITHDRFMLDRLCTFFLALGEKPGTYADYRQWEAATTAAPEAKSVSKAKEVPQKKSSKEGDLVEKKIMALEEKIKALSEELERAEEPSHLEKTCAMIAKLNAELEALYLQWEAL